MADPVKLDNGLGIGEIINVSVVQSQTLLSASNPNNLMLFSSETPGATFPSEKFKIYKSPGAVASDFASDSKAVKIANIIFNQSKNILSGGGYLVIATFASPTEKVGEAITRTSPLVAYTGILLDKFLTVAEIGDLASAIPSGKIFFGPQKDPASVEPTTGVFDKVRTGSNSRFRSLFYQSDDAIYMQAAYASRAMSVDFSAFSSTQTMQLKSLVNVNPDDFIDSSLYTKIKASGADTYTKVEGIPCVLSSGKNKYFDQVHNQTWLVSALQVAGFNFFRGTNTKVPQTLEGILQLKAAYRAVCDQAVFNGYAAPGEWTIPEFFGNVEDFKRNIREKGYYIFIPPITTQTAADREERKAPAAQIAIKESGALHSSNVIVNLNA